MQPKRTKLSIIGVGRVGAAFAYAATLKRLVNELVLVDVNPEAAEGEAMDLAHCLPLLGPMTITAGDYDATAGSDIVVITAGANQKPGQTRLDLLETNIRIVRDIAGHILALGGSPILLIATNPVDVLTLALQRSTGLPESRVIGSGTVLDTSRFRQYLAADLGVDQRSVHAHIVGEHGDSTLPVWSTANVSCVPLTKAFAQQGLPFDEAYRQATLERVRRSAYEVIERKGATANAIGVALCRIVETILDDQHSVLNVSTQVGGLHGLPPVCLSLPCVLGQDGVEQRFESLMSEQEYDMLHHSADILAGHARSVGILE